METTVDTETAIVPALLPAPKALARPTTPRAIVMAEALKEDTEQRALLQEYVQRHMRKDVDFGIIPGTAKPTLLKPGAEKLTDLFRCTPTFDLIEKLEDWEAGLFHYTFRVRITSRDAGTVLAEGFGSANSREGRYRWRNANRKCPQCGKETIIKGKEEYGGGWVCFAKKGGCGAKWGDGAPEIEGQEAGKVENDDIYTLVNTILKMAKKRALVDGAIALARCSDIFTQDVEDFAEEGVQSPAVPRPAAPAPKPQTTTDRVKERVAAAAGATAAAHKSDAPRHAEDLEVKFGRNKGKQLSECPDADVRYLIGRWESDLADPAKSRFHASAEHSIAIGRAILASRSSPPPAAEPAYSSGPDGEASPFNE